MTVLMNPPRISSQEKNLAQATKQMAAMTVITSTINMRILRKNVHLQTSQNSQDLSNYVPKMQNFATRKNL